MYYCQSRYYDPAVGRWLNADSLLDNRTTLSVNLFVYCGNNPVNCVDSEGNLPFWVFGDIHRKVLKHICESDPGAGFKYTETTIDLDGRVIYCDLYRESTMEVWELKHWLVPAAKAEAQLNNYTSGKLRGEHVLEHLRRPYVTKIPTRTFNCTSYGLNYNVTYWEEPGGLLRYSIRNSNGDLEPVRRFETSTSSSPVNLSPLDQFLTPLDQFLKDTLGSIGVGGALAFGLGSALSGGGSGTLLKQLR